MQLQLCDKCRRPLSEGCIARGEAVQREGELICSHCVSREPAPAKPRARTGLAGYEGASWNCEGCGIPVNAMDLIEGRASRLSGALVCSRCAALQPARPVAAAPEPSGPAQSASRRMPAKVLRPTAERFVQEVKREERRPILPILLFAVVLPMFAVSVYFAITYQFKLGEALAGRNAAENAPDKRAERPFEMLDPGAANDAPAPATNAPVEPARPAEPTQMTPEVARELAEIEQQLANPVIMQLQSSELPDVWEGLISAGSRRYIATRPFVRRLLREPDDNTRALACRVCALLADKEALPELDRMAESDPSEDVRIEARKAKGRLTGVATREIEDMSAEELEKYARELQKEIERRKGGND